MKRFLAILLMVCLILSAALPCAAAEPYRVTFSAENPENGDAVRVEAEEGSPSASVSDYSLGKQKNGATYAYFKGNGGHMDYDIQVSQDGIYRFVIRYVAKEVGEGKNRQIDVEIGENERRTLTFEQHGSESDYQPYYAFFEVPMYKKDSLVTFYVPKDWDDQTNFIIDYDWFSYEYLRDLPGTDDEDEPEDSGKKVVTPRSVSEKSDRKGFDTTVWILSGTVLAVLAAAVIVGTLSRKRKKNGKENAEPKK